MLTTTLEPTTSPVRQIAELETLLSDCRIACGHAADTWLASSPLGPDALRCIRLLLDCADLCGAAEELLPFASEINPPLLRARLNTCAVACERSAREAQRYRTGPAPATVDICRRTGRAAHDIIPLLPTVAVFAA